ncbi:hypothetical protein ACIPYQ_09585 [Streptomyces sp. NPDC090045]|uniref:hypothetical protein n=1 Tax=Streptomyces sp. NPDC090045 TaxID=3365927 RepID=UPI0037FC92FB
MSGADEGVPADAHTLWLSRFAEAAAVVLATPSGCREAMLGALDRCWEELRQVGRHQLPYADDAPELFDAFESARTSLEHGLWSAVATVDHSRSKPPSDTAVSAAPADLTDPERTDPDRTPTGAGATGSGGEGSAGQTPAGTDALATRPTPVTLSPPGDDATGPVGHATAGTGGNAGTAAASGPEGAVDQAVPAPASPPATGASDTAAAGSGTRSSSDEAGPGTAEPTAPACATTGPGGTPDAARGPERTPGDALPTPADVGQASTRPGTPVAGTTGGAAAVTGGQPSPADAGPPPAAQPGTGRTTTGTGTRSPSGDAGPHTADPGPAGPGSGTGTGTGGEAGARAEAEPAPDPLAGFADALRELEAELLAEQIRYLPRSTQSAAPGPPAAADRIAATWQRVHMALLRLPSTLRTEWRVRAGEVAAAAGLTVTAEDATDPDVIVPGLPQGLYAAERVPLAIAAPRAAAARVPWEIHLSLGTSPDAVTDLSFTDPRLAWAVRAHQALRLVELDPELHVAVLVEEQPSSLASQDERLRYRQHLHRLLGSAGSSQANGWPADSRLGAAHNLDMVLGGLVHQRPAAPDSWWWQWRAGVSRILAPLAESAGYELVPKPVGQWRKQDLDSYAVKQTVPGVGQAEEPLVQWVVWTPLKPKGSYKGNERKGRVVIRPATQYGRQTAP